MLPHSEKFAIEGLPAVFVEGLTLFPFVLSLPWDFELFNIACPGKLSLILFNRGQQSLRIYITYFLPASPHHVLSRKSEDRSNVWSRHCSETFEKHDRFSCPKKEDGFLWSDWWPATSPSADSEDPVFPQLSMVIENLPLVVIENLPPYVILAGFRSLLGGRCVRGARLVSWFQILSEDLSGGYWVTGIPTATHSCAWLTWHESPFAGQRQYVNNSGTSYIPPVKRKSE